MLLRTKHHIYTIIFLSDDTFGCLSYAKVPYPTLLLMIEDEDDFNVQ